MTSESTKKTGRPRGKYNKGIPDAPIPERIRLPDGRSFITQELLKQRSRTVNYNLLKNGPITFSKSHRVAGRPSKYTLEEREWQSQASAYDISDRYNVSVLVARSMKTQARKLVAEHRAMTAAPDTCVIINHQTNEQINC